jgi:hypothetical protein
MREGLELYLGEPINRGRQRNVAFRQSTCIMRRQQYFDAVVNIEPFGVVIRLFGKDRDTAHESKGFGKISQSESAPYPATHSAS